LISHIDFHQNIFQKSEISVLCLKFHGEFKNAIKLFLSFFKSENLQGKNLFRCVFEILKNPKNFITFLNSPFCSHQKNIRNFNFEKKTFENIYWKSQTIKTGAKN